MFTNTSSYLAEINENFFSQRLYLADPEDTTRNRTFGALYDEDNKTMYLSTQTDKIEETIKPGMRHQWKQCCQQALECCYLKPKGDFPPENATNKESKCPRTWDGWSCWKATDVDREEKLECPNFIYYDNYQPHCLVYSTKICLPNGTWETKYGREWTEYNACAPKDIHEWRMRYGLLSNFVSMIAILPALMIFNYLQPTRKSQRIKIHRHLLVCLLIHAILTAVQRINKLVKDNQLYEDQLRLFKSTTYTQEYTLPQTKDVINFTESNGNHWPPSAQQSFFYLDEHHSHPFDADDSIGGRRSRSPKISDVRNLPARDRHDDQTRDDYFKTHNNGLDNDIRPLASKNTQDTNHDRQPESGDENYYKRGVTSDNGINRQQSNQHPQPYTRVREISNVEKTRRLNHDIPSSSQLLSSNYSNALPSEKQNEQQEIDKILLTHSKSDHLSGNHYLQKSDKTSSSNRPSSERISQNDELDRANHKSRNKRSREKNVRVPAQTSIAPENLNQSSSNEPSKNTTQLVYFNPQTEMSTVYKVYCWSLQIALIYIRNCCYFWMFNEALYLHLILQMAPKEPSFRCLSVVAYTLPLLIVIVYTVARSVVDGTPIDFLMTPIIDAFKPATSKVIGNLNPTVLPSIIEVVNVTSEQDRGFQDICWDSGSGFAWIEAILDYPNYVLLALNVIFLVTLLRTMCGLQRVPLGTSAHDNTKTGVGFVGALRAACLLFPLYGFSFLVVSARPKLSQTSCVIMEAYYYIYLSVDGLQGVAVAILFCYATKEVRLALTNLIMRHKRQSRSRDDNVNMTELCIT